MFQGKISISDPDDLIFGTAPLPLHTNNGMVIGGGMVYPELNFTLPPMLLDDSTWPQAREHYRQIAESALQRAADLEAPGVVLEFETLPPMTENPPWAVEITSILREGMEAAKAKRGVRSLLRVTPNDNRELTRPPRMRSGRHWDAMLQTFEGVAKAGADFLSIESVGGKEIHDDALLMGDIRQVIFALAVLGVRDMKFLWSHIAEIARANRVIAAGDSACGFGNTAMVLAEQRLIPRVYAAIIRPLTAIRSIVAHECGAIGPGKDCAYENPFLKAITGFPMAMEGKTAACAHLSPLGNIAATVCDLWSNESVQNIKLLGGMAPTCYLEQLIYDCRLFNQAAASGRTSAMLLRDWLVKSDARLDPQAYILTPTNVIRISHAIVAHEDPYAAAKAVVRETIAILRDGLAKGEVKIIDKEISFLSLIEQQLDEMPETEDEFVNEMLREVDMTRFIAADYGIKEMV